MFILLHTITEDHLGEGNLIFCCMGSQESYVGSIGWQKNNNPQFQGWHIWNKNIDHWGEETCAIFGLPIHDKSGAANVLLPFFFDFNIMAMVYSETSL